MWHNIHEEGLSHSTVSMIIKDKDWFQEGVKGATGIKSIYNKEETRAKL